MIDLEEFEIYFKRLCRRFGKKINPEQCEVYFDCLQNCKGDRLEEAIERIIRSEKYFPTPGEIERVYLEIKRKTELEKEECDHCEGGFVFFLRGDQVCANPCAHCNEKCICPLVAKVGDAIFWASRRSTEKYEGDPVFISDLNGMKRMEGATYNYPASRKGVKVIERDRDQKTGLQDKA